MNFSTLRGNLGLQPPTAITRHGMKTHERMRLIARRTPPAVTVRRAIVSTQAGLRQLRMRCYAKRLHHTARTDTIWPLGTNRTCVFRFWCQQTDRQHGSRAPPQHAGLTTAGSAIPATTMTADRHDGLLTGRLVAAGRGRSVPPCAAAGSSPGRDRRIQTQQCLYRPAQAMFTYRRIESESSSTESCPPSCDTDQQKDPYAAEDAYLRVNTITVPAADTPRHGRRACRSCGHLCVPATGRADD